MSTLHRQDKVADAAKANWVDRFAPEGSKPYLRLARADRPIGTWLLLLPCWWGMALGLGGPHNFGGGTILLWAALFAIGALVMRGAGCTWNDITDKDYDAKVERTRSRPIPSGQVSVKRAAVFMAGLGLIGFLILISFNTFTIWLGVSSLLLVAAYPFMKRITWWPQLWLGLTFNWGILMGWSAVTGTLNAPALLLYAGAIFWTLGYDTIYAHQDKEDDLMVGVKSSAIRLGQNSKYWIGVFYGAMIGLTLAAGFAAGLGALFYIVLVIAALHLLRQIRQVNIDAPNLCLKVFKSNRDFGFIVLVAIVAGQIV